MHEHGSPPPSSPILYWMQHQTKFYSIILHTAHEISTCKPEANNGNSKTKRQRTDHSINPSWSPPHGEAIKYYLIPCVVEGIPPAAGWRNQPIIDTDVPNVMHHHFLRRRPRHMWPCSPRHGSSPNSSRCYAWYTSWISHRCPPHRQGVWGSNVPWIAFVALEATKEDGQIWWAMSNK